MIVMDTVQSVVQVTLLTTVTAVTLYTVAGAPVAFLHTARNYLSIVYCISYN